MTTSRRGFLGFLAAAGIVAIAGPEVAAKPSPAPAPTLLPKGGEVYQSFTHKRTPGFFDLICYVGTGSAITLPNNMGDEIGCVFVKCRSNADDWLLLEGDAAELTLPESHNLAGRTYVAYQFGKASLPELQPYIDKFKEQRK